MSVDARIPGQPFSVSAATHPASLLIHLPEEIIIHILSLLVKGVHSYDSWHASLLNWEWDSKYGLHPNILASCQRILIIGWPMLYSNTVEVQLTTGRFGMPYRPYFRYLKECHRLTHWSKTTEGGSLVPNPVVWTNLSKFQELAIGLSLQYEGDERLLLYFTSVLPSTFWNTNLTLFLYKSKDRPAEYLDSKRLSTIANRLLSLKCRKLCIKDWPQLKAAVEQMTRLAEIDHSKLKPYSVPCLIHPQPDQWWFGIRRSRAYRSCLVGHDQ